MDPEVGAALRSRCETFLNELTDMKQQAKDLDHLMGYGGLSSANTLRQKFEQKAQGGGVHDVGDSAVNRLEQHIEVVRLMRDTYAAAIGQLQATDQTAGAQLTAHTEGMN